MLSISEWIGETIVENRLRGRIGGRVAVRIYKTQKVRIHRHIRGIDLTADWQSSHSGRKNIRHVARRSERCGDRKNRSAERKLVYGAYIFTHIEDPIAAPNGGAVVSKQVVGKANPRSPVGGIAVV